jgi:outer membrane protein insertion porin family
MLTAANVASLIAADWEGVPVRAIRQQTEEARQNAMEPSALEEMLPQKTGEPYSSEKIRQSIELLYATGRFTDIRVDAESEAGGVALTFLTRSAYFVGAVQVRGVAAPPGENQLRSATHLELGHSFSENQIPEAIEGLREVLQDEGYFQPQIAPGSIPHLETQQMDLTFDVSTGRRARLGKVDLKGNPVFPLARLLQEAKWKGGKPLTLASVQNGLERIRKLYQKEGYLGASAGITAKKFHPETNSADLELTVHAGTRIELSVAGAPLSHSDLARLVPVFQEGSFDDELLDEGRRNLTDYFESQGYFDVKVSYRQKEVDTGRTAIEYQVEHGERQRLEDIRLSGNQYFSTGDLRERIRMQPARFGLPYGRFSSKLLAQDLDELRALYEKNGFTDVEVHSELSVTGEPERQMTVSIQILEGTQKRIGNFSIRGNSSFPPQRLESLINAGSGQPYSQSMIASDGDSLLTFYFDQGFSHAQFHTLESPAEDPRRVDVQYILDEGPREYVRHVYVSGLENTRTGVVNRQLQVRDGLPLSQSGLLETQRHLYDLGIFNRVDVAVQNPAGQEAEKNVLVYLEEARRYTMKLGLGAEVGRLGGGSNSSTNPEGKQEFSPDISFELTRLAMGGRPHTASLSGRFSTIQKRGGLTYTAPNFLYHPGLEASARVFYDESRDVRTFSARRVEGSLQFEEKRSRITTLLSRYSFRRVTVDTTTLQISKDLFPQLASPVLVGMVSQVLIRDTRDNPAESHEGMFTSADMGIAAKQFGSQTSFVKLLLQNSSYYRIGKRLVFARSSQFGVQSPFGKGREVEIPANENGQPEQTIITHEIPIAEHFFSGGSNSQRGFGVNQAGPRDPQTGFPLGGNALLLNSLELRFPIWRDSIGGVLFHDAGNVFTSISDLSLRSHQKSLRDFNYISHAVGFGLRYRTPIGPVRLDLGYSLNPTRYRKENGTVSTNLARWQVLFSIGQGF